MTRPGRYPQEVRGGAVRLVLEHGHDYPSEWAAISSIGRRFDPCPAHHPTITTADSSAAPSFAPGHASAATPLSQRDRARVLS